MGAVDIKLLSYFWLLKPEKGSKTKKEQKVLPLTDTINTEFCKRNYNKDNNNKTQEMKKKMNGNEL